MPTSPQPVDGSSHIHRPPRHSFSALSRSLGSRVSVAALVHESLSRDIEASGLNDVSNDSEDDSDGLPARTLATSAPASSHGYSLQASYRRGSYVAAGSRGILADTAGRNDNLNKEERKRVFQDERSLLRDNHLIPPKHPRSTERKYSSSLTRILSIPTVKLSSTSADSPPDLDAEGSESSALLADPQQEYGGLADPGTVKKKWDAAVKEGRIHTTWQRETKTLSAYSFPLIATFLLQYSLTVASIFTVGHIGKEELGAVSLASMTANITGYAIYQGLATSLDTLCPQAYGSGRKKLVGLQTQRMIYFLWCLTIPIALLWFFADKILLAIVPEPEVARLAGLYLKVAIGGTPGYAAFEAGKRFVQAQGLFSASLYILIIFAPINAFLNWFLVWKMGMGFVGAPIAVAITDNFLALGLFVYVRFLNRNAMSCWNGFTWLAWHNWDPMITLALPGVVMVEAEVFAFEILNFVAAYFGVAVLAAQSVLATITNITFQIPFPLSIAASTRVANLIGATLVEPAKLTTRVALGGAVIIGITNVVVLSALKDYIPRLFTSDKEVVEIVSRVLPLCAAFQLFDALAALCNGVLRGLGRQHVGGYVQLGCYYVIGLPVSMAAAFGLHWQLEGLWTGVALALALVSAIELVYIFRTDWQRSVDEAQLRNVEEV